MQETNKIIILDNEHHTIICKKCGECFQNLEDYKEHLCRSKQSKLI